MTVKPYIRSLRWRFWLLAMDVADLIGSHELWRWCLLKASDASEAEE